MKQPLPSSRPNVVNAGWRIGIVHSSFYPDEVGTLVTGAVETLRAAGVHQSNIRTFAVPGSFEIPLVGEALADAGEVDALIGLGIIVEGETHHARLIAEQTARGMMEIQVRHQLPFAFEVLYVNTLALAQARLDAGRAAANAVLHSLAALAQIQS